MIFWTLALLIVASAVLVVAARNVFHASIALVVSFSGVAGLYLTLEADFLAVVQLLIYVGAIAVLIVFAVMLTSDVQRGSRSNRMWVAGLGLAGLVFVALALAVTQADWTVSGASPVSPTVASADAAGMRLPDVLFSTYLLPFEIAGLLLLVATIGAIVIAREQ